MKSILRRRGLGRRRLTLRWHFFARRARQITGPELLGIRELIEIAQTEMFEEELGGLVEKRPTGNLRAAGTIEGASCDTGPMSFALPRSRRRG